MFSTIKGDNLKILGIDEAGRGCVLGPLVMCGFLVDGKSLLKIRKLGVKDSKLLTSKKRELLEKRLKRLASDFILLSISAKEIDKLRTVSNLNKMEIERMQSIINLIEPDKAIIDALEANTRKFHEKLSRKISNKKIKIVAENFADKNFTEVACASILAKVHRDREIAKLQKSFGDFGSGYSSDEKTINFLKDWIQENKEFPHFVRASWLTAQWIKRDKEQLTLRNW